MRIPHSLAIVIGVATATVSCEQFEEGIDTIGEGRWGGGDFEAGEAGSLVAVQALDYDLRVWDRAVEGCYEIVFSAESGTDLTAVYRFVLPRGAVIHRAEIYLPFEERWERAATLGRREGEEVFEEVLLPRPSRDPLLLQSIGPDVYRARAYPVSQGRPLRSRICYSHLVEPWEPGALVRVAFFDPDDIVKRTIDRLEVSVALESGPWSRGVWWSDGDDERGNRGGGEGTLENTLTVTDFDEKEDVVLELVGEGSAAPSVLAYRPLDERLLDHVHVAWQPDLSAYPSVTPLPRNVVFVVDVSGSMEGAKLREAKLALTKALGDLDDEDYYGLVAFDTDVEIYDSIMSPGVVTAGAIDWVQALRAGSSTHIAAGLASGAEIGVTSPLPDAPIDLILVTDGRPTAGATTAREILAQVAEVVDPAGRVARVFSLGIGHDLDQRLLNDLADESGGESAFALDDNEIADQFLELFARARGGGASDVRVELRGEGIEVVQSYTWRRIFPGDTLSLAALGTLGGDLEVSLTARAPDNDPIEMDASFFPHLGSHGEHLLAAPLAAMSWAERLDRRIDEEGETAELVDTAVMLAKQYGILTRYSSLLALETEEMYRDYGIDKLERDPAGIALEQARPSSVNEARVGGEGVDREMGAADADMADGGAVGCACSLQNARASGAWWLPLLGVAALARRRRRRELDGR